MTIVSGTASKRIGYLATSEIEDGTAGLHRCRDQDSFHPIVHIFLLKSVQFAIQFSPLVLPRIVMFCSLQLNIRIILGPRNTARISSFPFFGRRLGTHFHWNWSVVILTLTKQQFSKMLTKHFLRSTCKPESQARSEDLRALICQS